MGETALGGGKAGMTILAQRGDSISLIVMSRGN